jgi:serine protease Do
MPSFSRLCILLCISLVACPSPRAWAQPAGDAKSPPAFEAPKDVAGFQGLENRIKSVVAKVQPSVVGMEIGGGAGSGVIVSEDGLVMTAGHVVAKPGQKVKFLLHDGKTANGATLGNFGTADAGMARITDPGKWPAVEKGRSGPIRPGTWCIAMGHPLGYQAGRAPVVRVGRVLHVNDETIQTDCPIVSGDSGGPVFDLDGRVIGINSRISDALNANLHAAVDVFHANWDRLLKGDVWQAGLPERNGPDIRGPLRSVIAAAGACVVRVKCDGQDAALGTIVGPDGWVLTKGSELKGKIVCRLRDGRELDARTIGVHRVCDLAMLKIELAGLPSIAWENAQPSVGQWMVSAGLADDPLAVGVLSVLRRPIAPAAGMIGVKLTEKEGEAQIEQVYPQGPAEKAGVKTNDVVLRVNGEPTPSSLDVRTRLRKCRVGDVATLTLKRGAQSLEIAVQLARFIPPDLRQREEMNAKGVGVSKRADDLPAVFQHDSVVRPVDCGGPVVDLSGKVIGVNVARAGRTETYCLPTDVVLASMYDLMSGRLAPAVVEAAQKVEDEKRAAEVKAAAERAAAANKAAAEKAVAEKTPPKQP